MLQRIQKAWSQKGQGIVEYALILAFVVAIAAVALSNDTGIGQAIQQLFTDTGNKINNTGNSITNNSGNSGNSGGTSGGSGSGSSGG